MTGKNPLNDRGKREAALRELLGDAKYEQNREGLENAESVREAARFVREMREHAKFTQGHLARKLGVTQPRISEIERGNSPEGIGYALLRRVAKVCGFPDWPMSPVASLQKEGVISQLAVSHIETANEQVSVWATDGNDTLSYHSAMDASFGADRIDGGSGNDFLHAGPVGQDKFIWPSGLPPNAFAVDLAPVSSELDARRVVLWIVSRDLLASDYLPAMNPIMEGLMRADPCIVFVGTSPESGEQSADYSQPAPMSADEVAKLIRDTFKHGNSR
jgi:transcriptional regulator with XRE-family HTH domain